MMANQETSNKSSTANSNTSVSKENSNVKNANKPFNLSFKPASQMFGTSPAKSVEKIQDSLSDLYNPVKESVNEAMENSSSMVSIPVMIGIGVLTIALILITIFRDQVAYGFQTAWNAIKNFFQPSSAPVPASDPATDPSNSQQIDTQAIKNMIPSVKEVFNIADNKYKYGDAEPLCKAYGAELATYDQVKDAWDKGADWCNYGWIKGQAAVYPTQESTFNKLQAGPKDQKGACGVTGINGGYFDNPDLRFGVNCYGSKPSKSDADDRAQQRQKDLTPGALEYDRKVQEYKSERSEIALSPFNSTQWA